MLIKIIKKTKFINYGNHESGFKRNRHILKLEGTLNYWYHWFFKTNNNDLIKFFTKVYSSAPKNTRNITNKTFF